MTASFERIFAERYPQIASLIEDLDPLPLDPLPHFPQLKETCSVYVFVGMKYAHHAELLFTEALQGKQLIFLEKELRKIKGIFSLPNFCHLLSLDTLHIEYDEGVETLKKIAWQQLGEEIEIFCEDLHEKHLIEKIFQGVAMVATEFKDFGAQTFHNVFQNLLRTEPLRYLNDLFGQFAKVPAIICGAGPSLSQDLEQVKKWSSHALIFAGGATLEALSKKEVNVHFAATIDPNSHRSRFLQFTQFNTPFFVQFRMSKSIYRDIQGEKIWAGSSPGFFLEEALYQLLGLPRIHFDGGWVVSNFLAHMAYLLGCDPIILVGMDHCWNHEATYEKSISDQKEITGFPAKDMKGNSVWTKSDFFWAQDWFAEFALKNSKIQWFNATSSGLPIREMKHQSLSALWDEIKPKQQNLQDLVHQKIQAAPLHHLQTTKEIFQILIQSVQACEDYGQSALRIMENIFGKNPADLIEIEQIVPEIEQELFYQTVLVPMWEIWKYPHLKRSPYSQVTKVVLFLDVIDRYRQILIY